MSGPRKKGKLLTVQERLHEVRDYGLPYTFEDGNTLVKKACRIAGFLDGRTAELILDGSSSTPFNVNNISSFYAYAMSAAIGDDIPPRKFATQNKIAQYRYLDSDMIEVHGIYDTEMNRTHYFVLPAKRLLDDTESSNFKKFKRTQ